MRSVSKSASKTVRPQQRAIKPKSARATLATLETDADMRRAVQALRRLCPVIRNVHDLVGTPTLRRSEAGFSGLARVVVAQQLSAASAAAIWKRTAVAVDPFDAPTLLAQDTETLRTAGLSAGKIRTLRAAAEAVVSGSLRFDGGVALDELRAAMVAVTGVGPWTADIYTLFCLGHPDAFAPGDLALQLSAQRAFALEAKPSARELEALAERWRPWRGVAAHLLWAFHVYRAP
jgi:DNA-3-methyladenine glycosylase II